MKSSRRFRVGEWVEVRSKAEILETLDKNGQLDGLPFMPEMFAFCGKRFRVYKRAHKTCDTVFPTRMRRMADAVHLEGSRCDGQGHGGCQAACLIFWKNAWLKPIEAGAGGLVPVNGLRADRSGSGNGCTEQDVQRHTRAASDRTDGEPVYACQATQLPYATTNLDWWELEQYVEDYTSGNIGLGRLARGVIYKGYLRLINLGIGAGPTLRWLYDKVQGLWGAPPYPRREGKLPRGGKTPTDHLGLQAGELVRVKSYEAILATCDEALMNRGMHFDAEMVPYCGGTYRVLRRVDTILNEKTGKMQTMKNPCIMLEAVVCQARYSECRLFCPRSIYPYWREIWLERVNERMVDPTGSASSRVSASA